MSEEQRGEELSNGYGLPEPVPYVPYTSPPRYTDFPPSMEERHFLPPGPPVPPIPSPSMPMLDWGRVPTRRKGRRGLWITISVVAALLIVAIASFFVIRYVDRPTPGKTLD